MALANTYVLATNRIPDLFSKIRDGQAPDQVTTQLLKDWGFTSSNDRAFLPMLKAIGFLTSDGRPTQRYHNYRDHSQSKAVLGEALKDAYGDIFLIKSKPAKADKPAVQGKFKSFHNVSDNVAQLMTNTLFSLLELADLDAGGSTPKKDDGPASESKINPAMEHERNFPSVSGLHYNIQIHLPATKDVEVYNSIFKSLREHLLES